MDTAHWHIPSDLHTGTLTGLRGGPDIITGPVPHSVRGTQRQHRPIPELAQPAGRRSADGVWAVGPSSPLLTDLAVFPHEDIAPGATNHIVGDKV